MSNIEAILGLLREHTELVQQMRLSDLHQRAWKLFGEDFYQVWLEKEKDLEKYVLYIRRTDLTESKREVLSYVEDVLKEEQDFLLDHFVWKITIL